MGGDDDERGYREALLATDDHDLAERFDVGELHVRALPFLELLVTLRHRQGGDREAVEIIERDRRVDVLLRDRQRLVRRADDLRDGAPGRVARERELALESGHVDDVAKAERR